MGVWPDGLGVLGAHTCYRNLNIFFKAQQLFVSKNNAIRFLNLNRNKEQYIMVSTCSCRKCLGSACGPTQLVPLHAPPATTGRQELVGDIWLLPRLCETGFFTVLFLWGEEWAGKCCCWNRAGPSSPQLEQGGTRTASPHPSPETPQGAGTPAPL